MVMEKMFEALVKADRNKNKLGFINGLCDIGAEKEILSSALLDNLIESRLEWRTIEKEKEKRKLRQKEEGRNPSQYPALMSCAYNY